MVDDDGFIPRHTVFPRRFGGNFDGDNQPLQLNAALNDPAGSAGGHEAVHNVPRISALSSEARRDLAATSPLKFPDLASDHPGSYPSGLRKNLFPFA